MYARGSLGKEATISPTGKKEWMQERAFINEYDLQNSSTAALGTDHIREGVWQVVNQSIKPQKAHYNVSC